MVLMDNDRNSLIYHLSHISAIAASGLYQITLAVVEYKQGVFDCEDLSATLKHIDII